MVLCSCFGSLASAFVPPSNMLQVQRPAVEASSVEMMARKSFRDGIQGYSAEVSKNARPLSPGSNCARRARNSIIALLQRQSCGGGVMHVAREHVHGGLRARERAQQ